jgi:hypothetical protein
VNATSSGGQKIGRKYEMRKTFTGIAVGFVLLAAPATFNDAAAQSAAAVIGTDEVRANVETVDQQKRMVLLRGPTGALLTVHAGPEVRNLAQVKPGDRVVIRYTEAVAAQIVRPGDPQAGSTTSMARANPGERPAGAVVDHDRVRVTIEGVNPVNNTVAFIGSDRVPRTVTVQQPAMREFLRTLKVGDEVDVTFTEAVAVSVEPVTR